nr:MAG TPA: hypothetical protein [Bacteriophage sp.]
MLRNPDCFIWVDKTHNIPLISIDLPIEGRSFFDYCLSVI